MFQAVFDGVPPTGSQLLRWERVLFTLWMKCLEHLGSEVGCRPLGGALWRTLWMLKMLRFSRDFARSILLSEGGDSVSHFLQNLRKLFSIFSIFNIFNIFGCFVLASKKWGIAQRGACVKLSARGGSCNCIGECYLHWKYRTLWGIATIVSQYRTIWGYSGCT